MGDPGRVHIYYARVSAFSPAAIEAAHEVLAEDERQRAQRFHFDRDRRMYVVAHGLLRRAVARHVLVEPAKLRFTTTANGRPELAEPLAAPALRFSLSHTRKLAVCAIAMEHDVGIDIEDVRDAAPLEVAEQWFAPAEVTALSGLPKSEQSDRFFSFWTLKEAYVKARGLGLSLPLHQFAFELRDSEIRVSFTAECLDDANAWKFASWVLADDHRAAVALRFAGEMKLTISELQP